MAGNEHVTWGSRTLSGVDRYGRWRITEGMEDWWGSPDIRGDSVDRPDSDGELDLPSYNQARLLNLQGILHASGHDQLHQAGKFLSSSAFGRFKVQGHGPTLWADGKRNSGFRFLPITDKKATWQVRIKFVDPRQFGDARGPFVASVGSPAANVHHRGNYFATPKFDVAGSMPGGYVLTIMGQGFTVTQPLVSGTPHNVDYADGRLRINGVIIHGGVGYGFTPLVPPGVVTSVSIVPRTSGTATATLYLLDTNI